MAGAPGAAGGGTVMRFELPLPPLITNNPTGHWRARHARRNTYWTLCDSRQNAGLLPRPPRRPHDLVQIAATMYLWNPMDDDNAMARLKYAADWLRTRGYITDDRRRNIKWAGFPDQVITRNRHQLGLVLVLEPLESAP